jgi:hypothetical protein
VLRWRGIFWRPAKEGRKAFFFEKKKQKTFVSYAGAAMRYSASTDRGTTGNKSLLLLFFRKEDSFFPLS